MGNWHREHQMIPNVKKTLLPIIKNELSARLLDNCIEPCREQTDLGLILICNLTKNSNCHQRSAKAMSALFQIKRNLIVNCSVKTKLNAYTGYIVPIVTYASHACCSSGQNLHESDYIQKVATKPDLGNKCIIQKPTPSVKFNPLCLYIQVLTTYFSYWLSSKTPLA